MLSRKAKMCLAVLLCFVVLLMTGCSKTVYSYTTSGRLIKIDLMRSTVTAVNLGYWDFLNDKYAVVMDDSFYVPSSGLNGKAVVFDYRGVSHTLKTDTTLTSMPSEFTVYTDKNCITGNHYTEKK